MCLGHLCLLIGTYPEEKQTSHIFMTGGSLQIGARCPPSEAPPLPQDQETWGLISLDVCIAKRWLPDP